MADQIIPPLDRELTTTMENYIRAHGVELHLGTAAAAFSQSPGGRLRVELKNGEFVETDTGRAGRRGSPEHRTRGRGRASSSVPAAASRSTRTCGPRVPDIYAAGDAVEVEHTVLPGSWLIPLAGPANRQGRVAAENICGRDTSSIRRRAPRS